MTRKRFRREDWLDLGLDQLGTHGPEALKVRDLCKAAERTVGSFYHHFSDTEVFLSDLANHWRKRCTLDVIDNVTALKNPHDQAARLATIGSTLKSSVDLEMRNLAARHRCIQRLVHEVDVERTAYLQQIHAKRFGLDPERAKTVAQLEYAAFVGTQTLWKENGQAVGIELAQTFDDMISHFFSSQTPL